MSNYDLFQQFECKWQPPQPPFISKPSNGLVPLLPMHEHAPLKPIKGVVHLFEGLLFWQHLVRAHHAPPHSLLGTHQVLSLIYTNYICVVLFSSLT